MRSIVELLLTSFYHVQGEKLEDFIKSARHLPSGANTWALHRLRKKANAVLHFNPDSIQKIDEDDECASELEILSLLNVVRSLIEGIK